MAENGADSLTPTQRRALAALLAERDVRSAAAAAGIAERTLHRWLSQQGFKGALQTLEADLLERATSRLAGLSGAALDALAGLLVSENESIRLRAVSLTLDQWLKLHELTELEARLTRLEERMAKNG